MVATFSFISLSIVVLLGIMTVILPRRYAVVPLIICALYIPMNQQIIIADLNFYTIRIIIFFSIIRLVIKGEAHGLKLNGIDKALISWVLASIVIYTILWQTFGAFINRLGFAYNSIGLYFFCRFALRDDTDIERVIKTLCILIIPLTFFMIIESATGQNLLSTFGGGREFSAVRGGAVRASGPFSHAILAGTFGATMMPIFIGFWQKRTDSRMLGIAGFVAATIITISSRSAGAIGAYMVGVVGLTMWFFRGYMRIVLWGLFFSIVSLHLMMKAPVWFLMDRVAELSGGGGWHRSQLIDSAIRHFDEWWLMGTTYTRHWLPNALPIEPNMVDITNQYIRVGVDGGMITLTLFIIMIGFCFIAIGHIIKTADDMAIKSKFFVWSFGTSLFVHAVSFLYVSYFDQIIVFFLLLLAMISVLKDSHDISIGSKVVPP